MSELKSFVSRKKCGLLLRSFAAKEEDVPKRVEQVLETVEAALSVMIEKRPVIQQVDVLIFADARFRNSGVGGIGSRSDCGKTAAAMRAALGKHSTGAQVHEVRHGDLCCGILNYGIAKQMGERVDYTMILSPDARSYFNVETIEAMALATTRGARAVGVALNELTESVLEGRLANTFALWHNESLATVGMFDYRAATPIDDRAAHYMRGWSKEQEAEGGDGSVFYPLAGVEEVIPLARMVDTFGPCIAPILPQGSGAMAYDRPDPVRQPELWKRYISKFGTKLERQSALLSAIGCDLSFLKGGVLPAYRTF